MKKIIITLIALSLTSCSAEKIANYKGFPWLGNPTLDIQRVVIDGKTYIIQTNTNTGTTTMTTIK